MTPSGRALSNVHGPRGDWIIVTAAAPGGTALASASPVMLADAAACPGLLDLVTMVSARTWGGAAIGKILLALNTTLLFVALLLFGRGLIGATRSRFATFATGLAVATSPAIGAP